MWRIKTINHSPDSNRSTARASSKLLPCQRRASSSATCRVPDLTDSRSLTRPESSLLRTRHSTSLILTSSLEKKKNKHSKVSSRQYTEWEPSVLRVRTNCRINGVYYYPQHPFFCWASSSGFLVSPSKTTFSFWDWALAALSPVKVWARFLNRFLTLTPVFAETSMNTTSSSSASALASSVLTSHFSARSILLPTKMIYTSWPRMDLASWTHFLTLSKLSLLSME